MIHAEVIGQGFCVPVILPKWILELVFLSKNYLCPFVLALISKNPPIHVLRFDNEYPERGDENMVYLSCAVPSGDNNILDTAVNARIQPDPHPQCGCFFAKPSFEQAKKHCTGEDAASPVWKQG